MAQRYVRVKTTSGHTYYGLLQLNRSVQVLDAPPWLQGHPTDQFIPCDNCTIVAPCVPSKIIAVGKNYKNHALEMGGAVPEEPLLFFKPPTAVTATLQPIYYPTKHSHRVDYEGELAIVIGERVKNCTLEQAPSKIFGYTIANDVTARDLQKKDAQWTRAKGFDSFCPLGPWIVKELSPEARLQTFCNNVLKQSASISEMVFSPEFLVYYISQIMTLLPGDVILTGTPEGIGSLQEGDQVRIEIEGIGSLENTVEVT